MLLGTRGSAQAVTKIRIAQSTIATPRANACKATSVAASVNPLPSSDSLRISIEDDSNEPAKGARAITVVIGDSRWTIGTDSTGLSATGDWVGKPFVVLVEQDTFLCNGIIPALPEADSLRIFRLGLGGSFDFLNGVAKGDVYYDVTAFMPALYGHWGLDAGMVNSRVATGDTTVRDRPVVWFTPTSSPDSVRGIRERRRYQPAVSTEAIGLHVSLLYRLTRSSHVAMHFESQRRLRVVTSQVQALQRDTLPVIARDTSIQYPDSAVFLPLDSIERTKSTEYLTFIGIGVLSQFTKGRVEFRMKHLVAQRFSSREFGPPKGETYVVNQFRLVDLDHGFKLGGEIRSLLRRVAPEYVIYLAKDVSFSRLADFIARGDSKE